jgi:hypothetical protein
MKEIIAQANRVQSVRLPSPPHPDERPERIRSRLSDIRKAAPAAEDALAGTGLVRDMPRLFALANTYEQRLDEQES